MRHGCRRTMWAAIAAALALSCPRPGLGDIDIDTFDVTSQSIALVSTNPPAPLSDADFATTAAGEALGGERDLDAELTPAAVPRILEAGVAGGALVLAIPNDSTGTARLTWDGLDASSTVDADGLGGVDLTQGGVNSGILLRASADIAASATLTLYSGAGNFSQAVLAIPAGGPVDLFTAFATFAVGGGSGGDPTSVGAITLLLSGAAGVDVVVDFVRATCALAPCPSPTPTDTATQTATATVTATASHTAAATVTATPTASHTATASATPSASATPTLAPPILQISKRAAGAARPGGTLVYTLAFANTGGTTATGVVVSDTVPVATRFAAAASAPGWSCADGSPAGTLCTNAVPDLAAGDSGSLAFAVVVDPAPASARLVNVAGIAAAAGARAEAGVATRILAAAPAPVLTAWPLAIALGALVALARRRLR